jgi:hypothetical protein
MRHRLAIAMGGGVDVSEDTARGVPGPTWHPYRHDARHETLIVRAGDLDDDHLLALCVGPDGDIWPWIILSTRLLPDRDHHDGCACRVCVPHEQLGRLPRTVREHFQLRCGAPTRKGTPCRIEVDRGGDRCPLHRDAP